MSSVHQIHIHALMLTSALSWAIATWCGNKNTCQKVPRIPCGVEWLVSYRVCHVIIWSIQFLTGRAYMAWLSLWFCCYRSLLGARMVWDAEYWEKPGFSDKTSTCKRSGIRLVQCSFSEHAQDDSIAYDVNLTCQTSIACMIYLSGATLDISLKIWLCVLWCIRHFQIY